MNASRGYVRLSAHTKFVMFNGQAVPAFEAWHTLEANPDLTGNLAREECLALLAWNDRNGLYMDADSAAEGYPLLTDAEARDLLRRAVTQE